jgi:peptidylprolyl isomerase
MAIKNGDKIKMEYEGTLEDGTVFDSSGRHKGPLEFEVGAGKVIKGLEHAVIGMEKGEERQIKLQPQEAYGERNPKLFRKIPKDQLPRKVEELEPGMLMVINLPSGLQVPARIVEVTDSDATIDLNHPLAGKTLNFKIKIVDILS